MIQLKTFLLDDESVICEIIKREIKKRSSITAEFVDVPTGTGKEALNILSSMQEPPDLLFIDIRLNNGVTGFDVIDKALSLFPREKMYIAILTGCWEGSENWERSLVYFTDKKVDSVLGKWGIGAVLAEISTILDEVESTH